MKERLLLVDDEVDIRTVLQISLSDLGYEVYVAEDGEKALDLFREKAPPLVVTDIKMPGMDGIELLRAVKRENPDVEVLMITGHGDMDLAVKSLKFEATDFITKPIDMDVLATALKRAGRRILIRQKLRQYMENLESLVVEKSELRDHLSSLGLMLGSVSHGIKGLLTGLDGGMYLLDSGLEKGSMDQIREGWEIIRLVIGRIRKMVLDILFYAKERDLNFEPVEATALASEVALVVEPKARTLGIAFVREFDAAAGTLEADPASLQSALINILENAVDACLRDKKQEAHTVALRLTREGDTVAFEIADDGIGMDGETRDNLFTLFYSSKGDKGTGLGLFIADKIVRQHKGQIEVKSTPGKGSVFTVRIPAKPDGVPEHKSPPS